ncbi:YkgJ family cysteine cluster protein [Penaeicola halotolerans]|uniref:YkgJ family cysteine cluster protein n=1 Tax=Penaeicola halotolerans TaxID=2793196 RepID=UPI001CF8F586|nr:YkgJ family cysteine cluster protein [Penaeicola halotolerans]
MSQIDIEDFEKLSKSHFSSNKDFIKKLKKSKPKTLDETFERHHDTVFEQMDCLTCANCCKTTSPLFIRTDIDRLAKTFRMSSVTFIDTYLRVDEEGDYVLQSSPCPFLGEDNKCLVYEDRPKACREYPHTNRKKMHQILNLTLTNSTICPAVLQVLNNMRKAAGQ